MNYIHIETGEYPITAEQMRARHPDTLFPEPFEPFDGYAPVQTGTAPVHDPETHKAVQAAPVLDGDEWREVWVIVALTLEEIDAARRARVPQSVTRRQALQALRIAGLRDAVQPAIDAIADPLQRDLAQIEWDESQDFERQRPLLIVLASAIGLDDEGLDNLFIQAGQL